MQQRIFFMKNVKNQVVILSVVHVLFLTMTSCLSPNKFHFS